MLAFYDQVIAQEAYLRTAMRRASLRKLVGRLGYLPRPAVAAAVTLAASAEGRQPVRLPVGTAFRSQSFDGEPPQVFELEQEHSIHPLTNAWALEAGRPGTLGGPGANSLSTTKLLRYPVLQQWASMSLLPPAPSSWIGLPLQVPPRVAIPFTAEPVQRSHFLLKPETADLELGDPFLVQVRASAKRRVRTVTKVAPYQDEEGNSYTRIEFTPALSLASAVALADISLTKPTEKAGLWTIQPESKQPQSAILTDENRGQIILDGLYRQIRPGDKVLLSRKKEYRWFQVEKVQEAMMEVTAATNVPATRADGTAAKDRDGNAIYISVPPLGSPATRLFLNRMVDWNGSQAVEITVHYGLVDASEVTEAVRTAVGGDTAIPLASSTTKPIETPPEDLAPKRFLMVDKDGQSREVSGTIDFNERALRLNSPLSGSLRPPLKVFGNLIQASRGESVHGEILGSGNAALSGQTFKLKKKPLTYLAAPTPMDPRGVSSTLRIWVGGVRWEEAPSFFGRGPEDAVYILRQNDEGETLVIFGDGRRGRRLPTGSNNVVADYRFGAGAKAPPAGSISQLAKPVKGLANVQNPLPAAGGADAEQREDLRARAPRSALILGRAVSIQDFEAVASGVAGVRAVRAEWRWSGTRQRPVVQIWYIGAANLAGTLGATLRHLSDTALPLDVRQAEPYPLALSLDIEIDPRYREEMVLTSLRRTLMDPEAGILAPEHIGIGRPLYRSRLFERVLALPGPKAVHDIQWDGKAFEGFALTPGSGWYFDLEQGSLILNGREDFGG